MTYSRPDVWGIIICDDCARLLTDRISAVLGVCADVDTIFLWWDNIKDLPNVKFINSTCIKCAFMWPGFIFNRRCRVLGSDCRAKLVIPCVHEIHNDQSLKIWDILYKRAKGIYLPDHKPSFPISDKRYDI